MKNKTSLMCMTLAAATLALSGCSDVREQLGLEKDSPDEFAVIKRAPLEMPANMTLPPPNPGTPRPQEDPTIKQAKEAVLGNEPRSAQSASASEATLLQQAGANQAQSNIRATVNQETKKLHDRNKPVAEKLLNIGGDRDQPSATVVDAKKELERIRKNKEEGKRITEGNTPVIEE